MTFKTENISYAINDFPSYSLFYNRSLYKEKVYPEQSYDVQPIDLWYVSSQYGKVDQVGNTIAVNETMIKEIASSNSENISALNFVADAFEDLRRYMAEAAFQNKIETEDVFYFDLQPYRGFASPDVSYDRYMSTVYDSFYEEYMSDPAIDRKVTDFKKFLNVFSNYVEQLAPKFPISKSGFIMSRYITPLSNGLMLDLSNDRNDDDTIKTEKYINDPNFVFFTRAAIKHGFLIDKNAPWRIVADLGSEAMQKYMQSYNLSLDNLFTEAYNPVYENEIDLIKIYLLQFYNSYVSANPEIQIIKSDERHNQNLSTTIYKRVQIEDTYAEKLGTTYWMKYYTFIRGKELDRPWKQITFDNLIKTASQIMKYQNYDKAIKYLNRRLRNNNLKIIPLTDSDLNDILKINNLNTTSKPTFKIY